MPPTADTLLHRSERRFGPNSDSCTAARSILFDHLVGAAEQSDWYGHAEGLSGLEIDD
jgi:hypothetical protein